MHKDLISRINNNSIVEAHMDHKADVGLIHPHPKGHGCAHYESIFEQETPLTLGTILRLQTGMAGTVAAVGSGVEGYEIGDAVCGGARFGGFAEYAVVKAEGLQKKPENLSFEQAASYSAAYLTAYVALVRRGRLQAGETLLVHAVFQSVCALAQSQTIWRAVPFDPLGHAFRQERIIDPGKALLRPLP